MGNRGLDRDGSIELCGRWSLGASQGLCHWHDEWRVKQTIARLCREELQRISEKRE